MVHGHPSGSEPESDFSGQLERRERTPAVLRHDDAGHVEPNRLVRPPRGQVGGRGESIHRGDGTEVAEEKRAKVIT